LIVERTKPKSLESHKNDENSQDATKEKSNCSIEEALETSIKSLQPILIEDSLKIPLKSLDTSIEDEMKSKSNSRHRKLMKKSHSRYFKSLITD